MEDVVIWRHFLLHPLAVWRYVHADRRDAAIMNAAGSSRQIRIDFEDGFCAWLLPGWGWPMDARDWGYGSPTLQG
jgi:hypothetical protein